ncbi:MAG TPA: WD40 repeat domain-containing protein [Pirellulales bacterium]|nr:WD40 repeat domain-containing protein [Pirellulales bacterium]
MPTVRFKAGFAWRIFVSAVLINIAGTSVGDDTPVYVLKGSSGILQSLAFSPDGTLLLSSNGGIRVWTVQSREERLTLKQRGGATQTLFMPDGKRFISSDGHGETNVWNIETQESTLLLRDPNGSIGIALSADGATLAVFSRLHNVQFWDVRQTKKTSELPMERGAQGLFSADGQRLWVSDDRFVHAWDLPDKKKLWSIDAELKSKDAGISRIALSKNDELLAVAYGGLPSIECPIHIHDPTAGDKKMSLPGHRGAIDCLAFSPDGDTLATGGEDRQIKIWSVKTGEQIKTLKGHRYQVTAVAFSPDGKLLASAGPDATVRIWTLGE